MILGFLQTGAGRSVACPLRKLRTVSSAELCNLLLPGEGEGRHLCPKKWDLLTGLSARSLDDLLTSWKKELTLSYVFLFWEGRWFCHCFEGRRKKGYQGRRLMGHSLTGGHSFLLPGCGMMILSVFITVRVK